MLKASALSLVTPREPCQKPELTWMIRNKQNMVIESSEDDDEVPESVINLALRLFKYNDLFKEIINKLRNNYKTKNEDFQIQLSGRTSNEKSIIYGLLQDMYGIISQLHYNSSNETISGKIILSSKAQMFITGQYMEIAVYMTVRKLVEKLSAKHNKEARVYKNVRVATREGLLKNEFDLLIEFGGIFYVIEVKSGKNFREYGKYITIGHEYQIVPRRFLLVNSCLSDEHASSIEYFCDYYVTNLSGDSLEKKLTLMIENDLEGDNDNE